MRLGGFVVPFEQEVVLFLKANNKKQIPRGTRETYVQEMLQRLNSADQPDFPVRALGV